MKRLKIFWKKYWADTKILYRQYMEEGQQKRDGGTCGPNVNPSTGMPMISSSVDCMGNAFGTNDWSSRR